MAGSWWQSQGQLICWQTADWKSQVLVFFWLAPSKIASFKSAQAKAGVSNMQEKSKQTRKKEEVARFLVFACMLTVVLRFV